MTYTPIAIYHTDFADKNLLKLSSTVASIEGLQQHELLLLLLP